MARFLPAETDILCERCGYILSGLPPSGNCPECGTPIEQSVGPQARTPPLWEQRDAKRSGLSRFVATSLQIIFRPKRFFRGSTSRGDLAPVLRFARIHWIIAAVLFGSAAWIHWTLMFRLVHEPLERPALLLIALPVAAYGLISFTTRLATRLTVWEAAYRGYRLPHPVVLRALYYHSAHYFPVALLAFATVAAYAAGLLPVSTLTYLYVLSGEVVVLAIYLFNTYWIAMRNLMYANR